MASAAEIAGALRASLTSGDYLEGMRAPTRFFAKRMQVHYVPPRSTDGWFDGADFYGYQDVEAEVMRSVMPDAHFADVQVVQRGDDQVISVMTLAGTLDGSPFACPLTMVYDVRDGAIVRVVGLYDQQRLTAFSDAFAEAAKTKTILTEVAPLS